MRKHQGITLPELLIVIAVISIVAAMLLPLFNAVMSRSIDAQCLNNLRQTGAGLFAYAADHQQMIPTPWNETEPETPNRAWAKRLVHGEYIENPDVLYCPAFFPKNDATAVRKASVYDSLGPQTYGMRNWVAPGQPWTTEEVFNGNRRLVAIESPSDFFLIADSLWTAASWQSQGYSITPGDIGQLIHLRHQKMANALFADGHVKAKPEEYFKALAERQRAYTGNQYRMLNTIEKTPF